MMPRWSSKAERRKYSPIGQFGVSAEIGSNAALALHRAARIHWAGVHIRPLRGCRIVHWLLCAGYLQVAWQVCQPNNQGVQRDAIEGASHLSHSPVVHTWHLAEALEREEIPR
jgi:hypothetical protein